MSEHQYMTATYSPDDNKLRLSSVHRLDAETYTRVKAAGFAWAPKQGIFVAPMWTPEREDLLMDLCGDIGDEDTSLVERAEQRAERFEDYSERRASDAERAHEAVAAIADGIPMGQPILVGHHSERHARRDAEKIENGMRRAVKMWETSKYWQSRAAGAIRHAKYRELPAVRARRIKTLEAEQRKAIRSRDQAKMWLHLWTECANEKDGALQAAVALKIASACNLSMPRKEGDRPDFNQRPDVYTVLSNSYPNLYAPRTLAEVLDHATSPNVYPPLIARYERWITHYENRLGYERAMLEEAGASSLLDKKPRPKQLPLCNYRAPEGIDIANIYRRGETLHYTQVEMTQAEYAKIWTDYKGTRVVDNSHRIRTAMIKHSLVCVFLTDSKVHERPAPIAAQERAIVPRSVSTYTAPEPTKFDAMRDSLKAGVQVVSAPQLFPTPPELAARMVEEAKIQDGMEVLEPSAGTGAIVDAIRRQMASGVAGRCAIRAVEIDPKLAHRLAFNDCLGGERVTPGDFLAQNGNLGKFDRVLMNPPFADGADIDHVRHAYGFLKPCGRLVAIMCEGPFFRSDRKSTEFRAWLDSVGGTSEQLPSGTFKDSGTGVNTRLVVIDAQAVRL